MQRGTVVYEGRLLLDPGLAIAISLEKPPVVGKAIHAGLVLRATECPLRSRTGSREGLRKLYVAAAGREGGRRSNADVTFIVQIICY